MRYSAGKHRNGKPLTTCTDGIKNVGNPLDPSGEKLCRLEILSGDSLIKSKDTNNLCQLLIKKNVTMSSQNISINMQWVWQHFTIHIASIAICINYSLCKQSQQSQSAH